MNLYECIYFIIYKINEFIFNKNNNKEIYIY